MKRKFDRPKHLAAFTLLEMLITLTIFAITMVAVYNLMGMSVRILDRNFGGDTPETQSAILFKYLDFLLRDSRNMTEVTNGVYRVDTQDGRQVIVEALTNGIVLSEIQEGKVVRRKALPMQKVEKIDMEKAASGGRACFRIQVKAHGFDAGRVFLLGYAR
jgi:prepilin-type N-terminal cleavage/methylation domain-containing protein